MRVRFILLLLCLLCVCAVGCSGRPEKINALLEQGDQAFEEGRFEEAMKAYDQVIQLQPRLPMAYNDRGRAYVRLARYEEAIADFKKAIELEPQSEYYTNLGLAFLATGAYKEGAEAFTEAIEQESRNADLYIHRAQCYDALDQNVLAVSDYTQAIELDPDGMDAAVYNNRGTAYFNLGEYEQAVVDYNHALALEPEDELLIYRNRAESFRSMGDMEHAVEDMLYLMEKDPDNEENTQYRHVIASYYLQEQQYDKAIEHLKVLSEEDPENVDLKLQLADCAYIMEDYEQAIEYYSAAIKLKADAVSYGNRADCYLKTGNQKKALKDLNKAIKLDPEYGWAYYMRAQIYLDQEEYEKAEADLSKAQSLSYNEQEDEI